MKYKTLADCPPGMRRLLEASLPPDKPAKPAGRSKYRNIRASAEVNGIEFHFDSKLERDCFLALVRVFGFPNVAHHPRRFVLPGGVSMIPDFSVRVGQAPGVYDHRSRGFYRIHYCDAKGPEPTADWRNKRKQVAFIYGEQITVIHKPSEIHRRMFEPAE